MKQIHNDTQRDTWGQTEGKAKTHRREFPSFLPPLTFSWVSKFSLGSSHTSFPPPSPFGTYLMCSVRPEPSMVLAPHRCSFSEMSFYKRQHSAISDGKKCARLREATQLTHMPPTSPASAASSTHGLYSDSSLCLSHPGPHVKIKLVSSETSLSTLHPSNFLL